MSFAVLISNYNHAVFLDETFASLLATSEVDKVFIIDDGSQDNSIEIIRNWVGLFEKFVFLDSKVGNIGYSNQINQHFNELNNYDFGMFLDSDDKLIPHSLSFAIRSLEKEKWDALFAATELIDEVGDSTGLIDGMYAPLFSYPEEFNLCCLNPSSLKSCNPFFNTLLTQNWVRSSSNILFKVSALSSFIPMPAVSHNPDWYIALALSMGKSVGYTGLPISQHRIHSGNFTSNNIRDSRHDSIRIFESLQKFRSFKENLVSHGQLALSLNPYLR